jgi:hypothetical protein
MPMESQGTLDRIRLQYSRAGAALNLKPGDALTIPLSFFPSAGCVQLAWLR